MVSRKLTLFHYKPHFLQGYGLYYAPVNSIGISRRIGFTFLLGRIFSGGVLVDRHNLSQDLEITCTIEMNFADFAVCLFVCSCKCV